MSATDLAPSPEWRTQYSVIDRYELSPALIIDEQSIGVLSPSQGLQGVNGILMIGPVDLTQGTVTGMENVPTVTDNLKSEGKIPKEPITISYRPITGPGADTANGKMSSGFEDSSKYTRDITYMLITSTSPANKYWGIVDTGTTLLLMSSGAYKKYMEATGAKMNEYDNSTLIPTTFEMTPNAQIWPRSLNAMMGGKTDGIYLVVADMDDMGVQPADVGSATSALQANQSGRKERETSRRVKR
ncbi:hypothetical protein EDD18DRAFT_1359855 [Armillaria luteobubalina]|uniref:Peptidase A1 domain-containing protein n=1 Tax=Armillaria luteobubalina TaxID=153913 RepID=A0AA39PRZ3_9AGAR|nr:hypothetical protein EDD18DRAFT_1359855 [Armillaria luteobubalina]